MRGINAMMDLSRVNPTHPYSWTFQANNHGRTFFCGNLYELAADPTADKIYRIFADNVTYTPPVKVYSQCTHGNWWFVAWHRAYLYYFERIVRHLADDPTLSIPYWQYSKPSQRDMPAIYRQENYGGGVNPLHIPDTIRYMVNGTSAKYPGRNPDLNSGELALSASISNTNSVLKIPFYTDTDHALDTFGGKITTDTLENTRKFSALEHIPHNAIHDAIGGIFGESLNNSLGCVVPPGFSEDDLNTGFMGSVPKAARDPIFYLHHANVDRLWQVWIGMGQGRRNPVNPRNQTDQIWLNQVFNFYDVGPNGEPVAVQVTPKQLLRTGQLGYTYEDVDAPSADEYFVPSDTFNAPIANSKSALLGAWLSGMGMSNPPIPVSNAKPTTIPMALEPKRWSFLTKPRARLQLTLELNLADEANVYYEIYINPRNQADLRHTSRYFAGQFSLFSAPMVMPGHMAMNEMEMVLTLNRRIQNAILKNQIDRTSLKVVLVPRTGTVDQNMLEGSVGSIGSNGEITLSATASKLEILF
jgi:tyrosinase